jgi:hypothetical protein
MYRQADISDPNRRSFSCRAGGRGGLHRMAGVARFAGEGMPGDDVAVLRIRGRDDRGQNRGERHPGYQ